MEGQRYVPEHPLPNEIQSMGRADTVCQFCGVSYLIHNEMKALEERVKEAERQMEYYKGSVQREEELKVKVKGLERENETLCMTLQASEERSKVFIAEITSKSEKLDQLKLENTQLENKISTTDELNSALKKTIVQLRQSFGDVLKQVQTLKLDLKNLKASVTVHYKGVKDYSQGMMSSVTAFCGTFSDNVEEIKSTLDKANNKKESLVNKCKQLQIQVDSCEAEHSRLQETDKKAKQTEMRCNHLEKEITKYQGEIKKLYDEGKLQKSETLKFQEIITSTTKELEELKQKFQNIEDSNKREKQQLQDVILTKEKEIYGLMKEHENLQQTMKELSKTDNNNKEMAFTSREQIKILNDLLADAKNEITGLQEEREQMITAHHNRIEQLRESFKKKMDEADAWPAKFEKAIREQQQNAKTEKDEMWKELNDSFQRDLDQEQQRHDDELKSWKTEAKNTQNKFKEDLSNLNRKHRDEMNRMQLLVDEKKNQASVVKDANSATIANLEDKLRHLEGQLRQRSTNSGEEAAMLRVHELQNIMNEADQHIQVLEIELASSKDQVIHLQETVRCECEERLELTDALTEARTQLLSLQRNSKMSFSRTSLNTSSSSHSQTSSNRDSSNTTSCLVRFEGVNVKPPPDSGRQSRSGSVDDSRQRIQAALGRHGSKSRLGDNSSR